MVETPPVFAMMTKTTLLTITFLVALAAVPSTQASPDCPEKAPAHVVCVVGGEVGYSLRLVATVVDLTRQFVCGVWELFLEPCVLELFKSPSYYAL